MNKIKQIICLMIFFTSILYTLDSKATRCESDIILEPEDPSYFIKIPGTEITVGTYHLSTKEYYDSVRLGFRINDCIYFLSSTNKDEFFTINKIIGYGIYKDLFLVNIDMSLHSGQIYNLFLFRVGKDHIEFLDSSSLNGLVKTSNKARGTNVLQSTPLQLQFNDLDHDDNPEIVFEPNIGPIIEVLNNKFWLETNSDLYTDYCKIQSPPSGPYTGWQYGFCHYINNDLDVQYMKTLMMDGRSDKPFTVFMEWLDGFKNFSEIYTNKEYVINSSWLRGE